MVVAGSFPAGAICAKSGMDKPIRPQENPTMTARSTLIEMGKALAKELARGEAGGLGRMASAVMEQAPELVLDLLDLMVAENAKKRPNQGLLTAFGFMLGQGLEFLRYGLDRASPEAAGIVAELERRLLDLGRADRLDPALLLVVLQQYGAAKLPPGESLRELMGGLMERAEEFGRGAQPGASPAEHFADLVRETGGDPFLIQGEMARFGLAFPEDHRAAMAHASLTAEQPAMREASIGWLLDEGAMVRATALDTLAGLAARGDISPVMLRRLIGLRNWLPEGERSSLDSVIQACRRKEVACAPLPAATILDVAASGIDGAGAQSFFVLVKEGRKHAVASLLVKFGVGIPDAWVQHGLTKREADSFLMRIEHELELFDASAPHLAAALAHFLAIGLERGKAPPFGLLDFVETAGLSAVNPGRISVDALIDSLLEAIPPARRRPASVNKAVKDSALWAEDYAFTDHWFEDDETVSHALSAKKRMSDAKRMDLLLADIMPARRLRWAEIIGWTAAMLRQEEANADWPDFALVASELLGERPLAEISVMARIAWASVEAWKHRG